MIRLLRKMLQRSAIVPMVLYLVSVHKPWIGGHRRRQPGDFVAHVLSQSQGWLPLVRVYWVEATGDV